MLWRDASTRLKGLVNMVYDYEQEIQALKEADVLYIDDFFKTGINKNGTIEKPSEADIKLAHEILNVRYMRRDLITIISSEFMVEEILDFDEAVGSRIFERSKGYMLEFSGKDKNQRLQ